MTKKRAASQTPTGINRRTDAEARKIPALPDLLSGESFRAIAKKHSVSETTVRRWAADPVVREALESAKDEALSELRRGAPRAAQALVALFDSPDERVQLQAILAVLDRAGIVKGTDKLEVGGDLFETLRELIAARRSRKGDNNGDDD